MRTSKISRKTKETHIEIEINLDGKGEYEVNTGVGFFNHMLETISRHSLIDMKIGASGDINVDYHHLVEDTGIVLGKAIMDALGDKKGIKRFGDAIVPLDEALVKVVMDISGRPYCETNFLNYKGEIGSFNFELGDVFFKGFASMGFTLHIIVEKGNNLHHILEASCKAFAKALREAIEVDKRILDILPSTKEYI